MTTPLSGLMTSTNGQAQEPNTSHAQSYSTKPKPAAIRGKKPCNKAPSRKKQPQRGMGVAQLERLRVQERWKTITEANQLESLDLQPAQLAVLDPINSVPLQCGTVNSAVSMINGCALWGLSQAMVPKRTYNGGDSGLNCGFGLGQICTNPYLAGPPDMKVQVGAAASASASAVFETSKELPSMTKIMQQYDPATSCDVCFKKKKFYGVNMGYNGRRDSYPETSPIIGSDHILGLKQETNKTDFDGEVMDGFKARAARSALCANHNLYEGVEVMAVHRKSDSDIFMEYEFLPGNNGKSTGSKDMEFPAEKASVAVDGEASCVTISAYTASTASNASNSIDLSLKL